MFTKEMVKLFEDYANEYNMNPDSNQSDLTFEKMHDEISTKFDSEMTEKIVDTICIVTSDNKINSVENLMVLDFNVITVDFIY